MISAKLLEAFAAGRTDLPHPIELPAIRAVPYGPVPDYADELVECGEGCGNYLTARELDEDYDGDSEGNYRFCGLDNCACCEADEKAA